MKASEAADVDAATTIIAIGKSEPFLKSAFKTGGGAQGIQSHGNFSSAGLRSRLSKASGALRELAKPMVTRSRMSLLNAEPIGLPKPRNTDVKEQEETITSKKRTAVQAHLGHPESSSAKRKIVPAPEGGSAMKPVATPDLADFTSALPGCFEAPGESHYYENVPAVVPRGGGGRKVYSDYFLASKNRYKARVTKFVRNAQAIQRSSNTSEPTTDHLQSKSRFSFKQDGIVAVSQVIDFFCTGLFHEAIRTARNRSKLAPGSSNQVGKGSPAPLISSSSSPASSSSGLSLEPRDVYMALQSLGWTQAANATTGGPKPSRKRSPGSSGVAP